MLVRAKEHNGALVVMLDGELDHHAAEYTRSEMDRLMAETRAGQIILDLAALKFMDSTGIGVLIGRYKKMQERNVPIFIQNCNNQPDRIFQMSGLYTILPKKD